MDTSKNGGSKSFLFLLSAALLSANAWAQITPLEEVVVTAQKREQSLMDVPMSVQVLSGETFIEQGLDDLQDAAPFIPGLTVEQTEGQGVNISIRGINNLGYNVAFEQATAVFNDGVYYGRSLQGIAGVYDIDRMEVLFGPQPVFFGQSAIAGLISYSSKRPGQEFDGYVLVETGNLGHQKLEGAVSIPLSDTWAARFSAKTSENDGWVELYGGGDGNASKDDAYRFQIEGQVTDNFSIWAKYEDFEQETDGFAQESIVCNPALATAPPLTWCDDAIANNLAEYEFNRITSAGGSVSAHTLGPPIPVGKLDLTELPGAQLDALGVDITGSASAVEMVYEFDNGMTLTSLTGLSDYDSERWQDFDFSAYASLTFPNLESFDQESQEFRLQSNSDGPLNWMVGLYWQDHDLNFQNDVVSALPNPMGPSGTNATEYNEEASYFGAFASVTWELSDSVTLDYGVRYNDVEKDAYLWEVDSFLTNAAGDRISNTGPANPRGVRPTVVPSGTQATGYSGLLSEMASGDRCLGNTPNGDDCEAALLAAGTPASLIAAWGDTDLSLAEDDITYQFALTWSYSDDSSLFIRYAEAFKPGGFSRGPSSFIVASKGQYDAEKADSLEAGGHFGFASGRGRANVTAFTVDYQDRQVQTQIIDPVTGSQFFLFNNATSSSIKGFEADVKYITESGVDLALGMNYTDGEYDSFTGAACFNIETRNGLCPNGTMDLSGTDFDGLPKWSISGGAGYEFSISRGLNLKLRADFTMYDDFENTRPFAGQTPGNEYREQDGYTLVNLRAAIAPENGKWEVAVYGRNVTDELYWQTQPGQIGTFGTAEATVSRPDSWGLSFRYNIGD